MLVFGKPRTFMSNCLRNYFGTRDERKQRFTSSNIVLPICGKLLIDMHALLFERWQAFKSIGQNSMCEKKVTEKRLLRLIRMESLALFLKWIEVPQFNFAFKPSWSIKFSDKHPWCTYNLVFCGLPFKESKYQKVQKKQNWILVAYVCLPIDTHEGQRHYYFNYFRVTFKSRMYGVPCYFSTNKQ